MWTRKILGFDPDPAPGHVFAVEPDAVRYARFERVGPELLLREYQSESLGGEAFQQGPLGGPVRDIDRFSQAVGELVGPLPEQPAEASLVVPDAWLRVAFTTIEEFPRGTSREDVLRFKLRRMVPFRVEDLRIGAVEVPALAGGSGERRFMLGFAIEVLLAQLEAVFDQHGVGIGQVSNAGLSLLPVLEPLLGSGLSAVVIVTADSYTILVTESARPALHRFKSIPGDHEARARLVPRELRLTRDYLRQEVMGRRLDQLVLVASVDEQMWWKTWVEEAFDHPVRSLSEESSEVAGSVDGVPLWQGAPLLGAAARGVY